MHSMVLHGTRGTGRAVRSRFTRGSITNQLAQVSPLSTSRQNHAHQDYGSGAGNPAGEEPQKQGPNPSAHIEHPGPPPPDLGKESASGSPQPKIHSQDQPTAEHEEHVKKHNEEAEQRVEKSHSKVDDKVEKDYWKHDERKP